MTSFDRRLIDPDLPTLTAALRAGVEAVNHDMRGYGRVLPCVAKEEIPALRANMASQAEGACEWRVPGPGPNGVRAMLLAVWWTDFLERKHLRLLGGCYHLGLEMPLPMPSPNRPALACVYPDVCLIATQHRRPRLVCVCECGAWGEPGKLAWMGPTCGPCFDRDLSERKIVPCALVVGPTTLAFAPDGRLAIGCRDGVCLWDTEQGEPQPIEAWLGMYADFRMRQRHRRGEPTELKAPRKITFDPSGRFLGSQCGEGFWIIDLQDRGTYPEFALDGVAFDFAHEPTQFFAYFSASRELSRCIPVYDEYTFSQLMPAGNLDCIPFRVPYDLQCHDLALSPDGRMLAAPCGDYGLCFWDAYTREPRERGDERGCVGPLAWSPDGTVVACGVDSRFWKAVLWDVYANRRRAVIGGTEALHALAFTPDSRWLLTCEQECLRAWDVVTGVERRALAFTGSDRAVSLAISLDGGTVALGMRSGCVRLWPTDVLLPE